MKYLYICWMILGVVGFPASVGWLLHRWQQMGRAKKEHEKVELREKIKKTGIVMGVFLLILAGFILFSLTDAAKGLMK